MCNHLVVLVRREIDLPASREEVWEALTDEALLEQWLACEVQLDAREGGEALVRDEHGERRGVVESVEDGQRLVLTWWRAQEPPTRVELRLLEVATGTRVVVTEAGPVLTAARTPALMA
jgi:uncharacterized protein YndB with AHSA1/START domain